MFRTNDRGQVPLPPAAMGEGDRYWYTVELWLQYNWFIASFTLPEARDALPRTLILADLSQVNRYVVELGAQMKQVTLVTPSVIDGTDCWLFEELVEAWECPNPLAPDCVATLYVVASGKEYADSFLVKPAQLKKVRRVFPIEHDGNGAATH